MNFNVGDKVSFFARYTGDPVREGVVVWVCRDHKITGRELQRQLRDATGKGYWGYSPAHRSRGIMVRVEKPKGGAEFFAPLVRNVTLVERAAHPAAAEPPATGAQQ